MVELVKEKNQALAILLSPQGIDGLNINKEVA